MINKD